jgi:hypothetical protein
MKNSVKTPLAMIIALICIYFFKHHFDSKDESSLDKKIEQVLGKKISEASDDEIEAAFKSPEMALVRKEIAKEIYSEKKEMIDGVFAKYDMRVLEDAVKAYNELQLPPIEINRNILKEVVKEWKANNPSSLEMKN